MLRRQRLRRQRKRSGDALSDLFFGTAVPGSRKDRTMNTMSRPDLPVVVIGAGPVGLAAAAHLVERGLRPLVLERGANVVGAIGGRKIAGDCRAARKSRLGLTETTGSTREPP